MSTTSDSDEEPVKRIRYNRPLDADYEGYEQGSQTRRKWELLVDKISPSHDASVSLSSALSIDCSDRSQDRELSCLSSNDYETNQQSENYADEEHGSVLSNNDDVNILNNEHANSCSNDSNYIYNSYSTDESMSDSEFCSSEDSENYDEEHSLFDKVMFEASNLSVREVITMLSAISLRFNFADEARLELMQFLKLCAGPEFASLSLSKYMMSKVFASQYEHMTYHYYCNQCSKKIIYSVNANEKKINKKITCTECDKQNLLSNVSPNYFIAINIRFQLKKLFDNDEIFNDVINIKTRDIVQNRTVKSVYDGSLLRKQLLHCHNPVKSEYLLTFNFNTDGAPLTKSGKRGFWPLQLIINDLSAEFRFRCALLAGLLITEKEPKSSLMNLYMEQFVEQMNDLYLNGVNINKDDKCILFRFSVASCVVDSVCRPILQNRVMFNGYNGCSWCYQRGLYINTAHGIRYVMEQNATDRTHETHENDVKCAIDTGSIINGVKGFSALSKLLNFDMVWSFSYEYMHSMLLGVALQMWKEWKSGSSIYKLKKGDVEAIEERYLSIKPSHEIHRLPRSGIISGSAKPKASELQSWLFIFSLPCLEGILNQVALEHYSLFVKCAYILLKPEISETELYQCEVDILKFICQFEMLYGLEKMTFNVHILSHAVQSIRKSGPLCRNSAFPFESNIYIFKNYINGPNGMDQQIAKKHLQSLIFKTGNTNTSENFKTYCITLFIPKRLTTLYKQSGNVTYVGNSKREISTPEILTYNKCIFNGTIYHSTDYTRAKKTDDSIVQLQTGEFGQITKIWDINGECHFQLSLFQLFPDEPFPNVYHIRKIKNDMENIVTTSVNNIACKIILVNVKTARYLCKTPHNFEIQ